MDRKRQRGLPKSVKHKATVKAKEVKPFVTSRAAPPPKDDFEEEALEDAGQYAAEREYEQKKAAVRRENKERKRQGEKALRMPPKPKFETSAKARARFLHSDSEELDSDDDTPELDVRALRFEGQVILPGEPLKILSKYSPEDPAVFEAVLRGDEKPVVRTLKHPEKSSAVKLEPLKLKSTAKMEVVKADPVKLESAVKMEVVKAHPAMDDIKPCVPVSDQKPSTAQLESLAMDRVEPSITAYESEEEDYEGEEEAWRRTQSSAFKVEQRCEVQEIGDEEDEDYEGEEEARRQTQSSSFQAVEVYDSEEEEYEESDMKFFDTSLSNSSTDVSSLPLPRPETEAAFDVEPERPPFATTPEQLLIGPLSLDEDDPSMVVPAPINRFLREYQRTGVKFFYNNYRHKAGGILGDDMGLGKTVQVLAFLSAIMRKTGTSADVWRRRNRIRYAADHGQPLPPPQEWPTALIVCPTSLVGNWRRELDTWGYFEYEIGTTKDWSATRLSINSGYSEILLLSSELCIKYADDLKKMPLSVVIVDEAHRMKKPNGRLALAVKKLQCNARFALTGTLVQNRMDEMWSVMDFVRRGWAGTFRQWKDCFVRPIAEGHRHDAAIRAHTLSIMRVGELYEKVLPHFYLRRDKGLIADELPPKHDTAVFCPLGKLQSQVYERVIQSTEIQDFVLKRSDPCECGSGNVRQWCCHQENEDGDDVKTVILKMFHALGRVANHLALLYQNVDDKPEVRATNKRIFKFCMGQSYDPRRHNVVEATLNPDFCGKWTLLETLLQDWRSRPEENNKVLLFSNSVRLLKMIETFISLSANLASSSVDIFSGDVDKDKRMEMVDRFQDPNSDHWLMLVSTMAGGVGLNLTAANKVVIFDPNWNPANDLQAMDRAFRIGQKRPVDVYRLIGKGTVEENMYERQIYKHQRARQVNLGTFERRTHKGFEGAKTAEEQGDLFGVHNLFQYNKEGKVAANLIRIRGTELQIRQDNIIADFEREVDDEDGDDDELSKEMLKMRMAKAFRMASMPTGPGNSGDDDAFLNEVLSGGVASGNGQQGDILTAMGITTMDHNNAFRDSPEERMLYKIGLKIRERHPELLDIKANDAVRYSRAARPAKRPRTDTTRENEVKEEPWQSRFAAGRARNSGKQLVDLDDD